MTITPSKLKGVAVMLGAGAVLAMVGVGASGQAAKPREDVLEALLEEVRGLRVAMEQMTAAGPRVQLAMGRLQIQEQRLNATRRRLEDVRDSIANAERESAAGKERIAMMEDGANRAVQPAERDALNEQVKMFKAMLGQSAADMQRLRDQEAELAGAMTAEESRWTEISQRLDELERALSPRR
jgi:chromosome segregation ATPase